MHHTIHEFERERNDTNVESTKKLGMCRWRYNGMVAESNLVKKKAKNLYLRLTEALRVQSKQTQLIQQLKWLHMQHGAFGLFLCFPMFFQNFKSKITILAILRRSE